MPGRKEVPLSCYPKTEVQVIGTILVCNLQFAYIVANSRDFERQIGLGQNITINFNVKVGRLDYFDRILEIEPQDISKHAEFIGISIKLTHLKFNINKHKGIPLSEESLRRFQDVHMYTEAEEILTSGRIL